MYEITVIDGYKVCNGTYYHINTDDSVIQRLERARKNHYRIRIFYGDSESGRDLLEVCDVIGYIGRSCGNIKIPIILNNSRSCWGGAIITDSIVKITIDRETVYQHKNYKTPRFRIEESVLNNKPWFNLYEQGESVSCFGNAKRSNVEHEILFFTGKVNTHRYN